MTFIPPHNPDLFFDDADELVAELVDLTAGFAVLFKFGNKLMAIPLSVNGDG